MKTGVEKMELDQLMSRSLLDVFNERDAERRANAIGEVYSPNIEFYEQDGVVRGAAALAHKVQQLLDGTPPDWTFAPAGEVSVNHDLGRLPWSLGPAAGTPVLTGTDVAMMGEGRIRSLYVFIDSP